MSDAEIQRVLSFWFSASELDSLRVDSRMDRWFGNDEVFDRRISDEFGELIEQASLGELMDWTATAQGRLALILLLDQFRRNVYRHSEKAFARDKLALKICIEGTMAGHYKPLSSYERMFFFMPLQHAESLRIQEKSVEIYSALAEKVSETLRETFLTTAQFAELHRDIVAEFGRFPHRNGILGRENTEAENAYLTGDGAAFEQ